MAEEFRTEGQLAAALVETRRASSMMQPETEIDMPGATGQDIQAAADAFYHPALPSADRIRPGIAERMIGLWVGFYRTQISPALGARCSLRPSCSEYCLQAVRRHGWLGLTMYADRAVREPDVVRSAAQTILNNGRTLYADPVSDHDFWMRPRNR